jgi:hypothetical protein
MAANQAVPYFDKQQDALLFTLAASSANVSGRAGPQQRRGGQGCGGDLQSQSNHG